MLNPHSNLSLGTWLLGALSEHNALQPENVPQALFQPGVHPVPVATNVLLNGDTPE
jgi:hypothetical protein